MTWLTNQFLIAMPALHDSYFERTVTLICQHNEEGALGIVVNRTTDLFLKDIFDQLEIPLADVPEMKLPVHNGGPVQTDRGLILHESRADWDATLQVGNNLGLTISPDVLEAISKKRGPKLCMPLLGFAGWERGQLESEMQNNVWLSAPADNSIIFDTPVAERWTKAAALVGINLSTISVEAGHA